MPSISSSQQPHVLGVKAIIDRLEATGVQLSKQTIRRGLYKAAVVIRDEARRKVPVKTGALKKSIIAQTRGTGFNPKNGKPTGHICVVTIDKKSFSLNKKRKAKGIKRVKGEKAYQKGQIYPRNYAHLVEYGTKPHSVGKGSKVKGGKQKGTKHPGARPKPFFRPALDTKSHEAMQTFEAYVRADVEKIASSKGAKK